MPAEDNKVDLGTAQKPAQPWESTSSSSDGSGHDRSTTTSPLSQVSPIAGSVGMAGEQDIEAQPIRYGLNQEEIVISGISCRLPESDNMQEFRDHLMNGEDMITVGNKRWEPGFYELPKRQGVLKDLSKFDAGFFGVHPKQAAHMDPQLRLLLEVSYEALVDAGVNPLHVRGSRTGVFVGCSGSETNAALTRDPETVVGYSLTGCVRSMFANRLSYVFDFRGPSFAVDTACSSSLLAVQLAVDAMRQDQCDAALVAGTGLTLAPTSALQFLRLGMLSPQGKCQSFDANGDGYVRSEGVVAIFLQRSSSAHRCYATIVHAKSNTDGYKEQGITFPSGDRQAQLLTETYEEAGVNPADLSYVEAHGTGTKVGDPQEANAICEALCRNRRGDPLLIGSVKSNMGHAEPASGLAAVAKVLIAMEAGYLPANLHFREPNPNIPGLLDGRLKVVAEKTPWIPGYVGINSFGFGGSNTHLILKPCQKSLQQIHNFSDVSKCLPRLLCYSGRTEDAVQKMLTFLAEKNNFYVDTMISEQTAAPVNLLPFRGFSIRNQLGSGQRHEIKKYTAGGERRPVWFVYSGMGTQWAGMGRQMMVLEIFRQTIERCSAILEPLGVNVRDMILNGTEETFGDVLNCFTVMCSIQIAMTDVLKIVGLEPDGIVGHSTGEIVAGYCDGCLSAEETMLCAFYRGKSIVESNLPQGAMAALGLTWEEVKGCLPDSLDVACHNAQESVTVSGRSSDIAAFVDQMRGRGIFAKTVNSSGIPFHSKYMKPVAKPMRHYLNELLMVPRPRSSRWISSSVPESAWDADLARFCSTEYHVNNVLSPVLFKEAVSKIPQNSVIIEIAPHCLLQAVIKRTVPPSCTSVGLSKARQEKNLEFFLSTLGQIYANGVNIHPQHLYPCVEYPVPRGTPMLAPAVEWDHSQTWPVMSAGDSMVSGGKGACCHYVVDPFEPDSKDAYILDHVIDGRVLFPFTGYLELVWKTFCRLRNLDFQKTQVLFENVNVCRPTLMTKSAKFYVTVSMANGDFEIVESDSLTAWGRISVVGENSPNFYNENSKKFQTCNKTEFVNEECAKYEKFELTAADMYKELLLCGYEYGPLFRGLVKGAQAEKQADIKWTGNWVAFLDAMLQCTILAEKIHTLRLPVRLRHLRIDPNKHLQSIVQSGTAQIIRATIDVETRGCYAGGVEFCELVTQSVVRRSNISDVTVEKVVFVPYYDSNCVNKKEAAELTAYRAECHEEALECAKLFVAQNFPVNSSNAQFSDDSNLAILRQISSKNCDVKRPVVDDRNLTSHLQMLGVLRDLSQTLKQENLHGTTEEKTAARRAFAKSAVERLSLDMAWNSAWLDDRSAKVLLDVVCENTAGHHLRTAFLEPHDLCAPRRLRALHGTHPLLDGDWLLLGPDVDRLTSDSSASSDVVDGSFVFQQISLDVSSMENIAKKCGNQDLVVLDRILHMKLDIPAYIQAVCKLLREDGFLLVCEITQDFDTAYTLLSLCRDPSRSALPTCHVNGSRKFGLFLEHSDWLDLLTNRCGLQVVAFQYDQSLMTTLYLLRKSHLKNPDPALVSIDDVRNFTWIEPLQKIIQEKLNAPPEEKIWVHSKTLRDNGAAGLALCLREESYKNRMRCLADVSLSKNVRNSTEEMNLESETMDKLFAKDLLMNLSRDGVWGSMRHIPFRKDQMHTFRSTEHAFVNTLVKGDLSSLAWVESGNKFWQFILTDPLTQSLCDVHFASLNFRDVMLATGRLTPDAIPGDFTDRDCLLGMEYAGCLRNGGERVMGLLPAQALATTVIADRRFCWTVPDLWSLRDAATVPVVYSTVYYALIARGRLKRGESLLVHSGTGGVGQAAIRVALSMGCHVYATVGNDEKKKVLTSLFPQLCENHIGNSRTIDFELQMLKLTNGRGVDVVLNSLSEDKLQASVRCLAKHGRFLEIGKFDFANNSNLGMAVFLKNATFHGILLDSIFDKTGADEWASVYSMVRRGIEEGVVQPLASVVFGEDSVEDAFRFMAHGKHMGKVLIKIRDEEFEHATDGLTNGEVKICRPVSVRAVRRTLCHPGHVYILTGGLGGFGLELAKWLVSRGAKKLVLSSRSGVRTGYQARCMRSFLSSGVAVRISTLDIADAQQAARLVAESCRDLRGPLGGLFHLAMVLRDCLFENQSAKNFIQSAEAKYFGTKNLDQATRALCGTELQWFVVFSSVSCGRGNAGQTNYGWANSTMERIVEQRRRDGLCGLAVQWGAVGDVGVVAEQLGGNSTVVGGTLPQRMPSCLQTLDAFLCAEDCTVVSSFVKADTHTKKLGSKISGGDVVQVVARILGISSVDQLDPNANLGDLGLDSLMGVEIKQSLERDFELVLSMKDIRNLTLNKLRELVISGPATSLCNVEKAEIDKEDAEAIEKVVTSKSVFALFRLRMDINSLRPESPCVLLNGATTTRNPLFCVHSIEGVGDTLSALASKLDMPVYAFQCTPQAPLDSIESLAQFYINEMRAIQPLGPYHIVGYSYGACVAFEMATHLQKMQELTNDNLVSKSFNSTNISSNGDPSPACNGCPASAPGVHGDSSRSLSIDAGFNFQSIDPGAGQQPYDPATVTTPLGEGGCAVGSLVLLDGSHRYMKIYRNAYRTAYGVAAENLLNDALFETEALCGFTLRFAAHVDYRALRRDLLDLPTFDRRVDHVVSTLMATGLFSGPDTVKFAATSLCRKMQAADRYEPLRKFEGKITLVRAEAGAARMDEVGRDYGLSEVTTGIVDVHVVQGDHDTFIHGPSALVTADIIKRAIDV